MARNSLPRPALESPALTCYICKRVYREPTTIKECLHKFCKKCIYSELKGDADGAKHSCPECGQEFGHNLDEELRPDKLIEAIISKLTAADMLPCVVDKDEEIFETLKDEFGADLEKLMKSENDREPEISSIGPKLTSIMKMIRSTRVALSKAVDDLKKSCPKSSRGLKLLNQGVKQLGNVEEAMGSVCSVESEDGNKRSSGSGRLKRKKPRDGETGEDDDDDAEKEKEKDKSGKKEAQRDKGEGVEADASRNNEVGGASWTASRAGHKEEAAAAKEAPLPEGSNSAAQAKPSAKVAATQVPASEAGGWGSQQQQQQPGVGDTERGRVTQETTNGRPWRTAAVQGTAGWRVKPGGALSWFKGEHQAGDGGGKNAPQGRFPSSVVLRPAVPRGARGTGPPHAPPGWGWMVGNKIQQNGLHRTLYFYAPECQGIPISTRKGLYDYIAEMNPGMDVQEVDILLQEFVAKYWYCPYSPDEPSPIPEPPRGNFVDLSSEEEAAIEEEDDDDDDDDEDEEVLGYYSEGPTKRRRMMVPDMWQSGDYPDDSAVYERRSLDKTGQQPHLPHGGAGGPARYTDRMGSAVSSGSAGEGTVSYSRRRGRGGNFGGDGYHPGEGFKPRSSAHEDFEDEDDDMHDGLGFGEGDAQRRRPGMMRSSMGLSDHMPGMMRGSMGLSDYMPSGGFETRRVPSPSSHPLRRKMTRVERMMLDLNETRGLGRATASPAGTTTGRQPIQSAAQGLPPEVDLRRVPPIASEGSPPGSWSSGMGSRGMSIGPRGPPFPAASSTAAAAALEKKRREEQLRRYQAEASQIRLGRRATPSDERDSPPEPAKPGRLSAGAGSGGWASQASLGGAEDKIRRAPPLSPPDKGRAAERQLFPSAASLGVDTADLVAAGWLRERHVAGNLGSKSGGASGKDGGGQALRRGEAWGLSSGQLWARQAATPPAATTSQSGTKLFGVSLVPSASHGQAKAAGGAEKPGGAPTLSGSLGSAYRGQGKGEALSL